MSAATLVRAPSAVTWDGINWAKVQRYVRGLQTRIVKATQSGGHNKARALQWLRTAKTRGCGSRASILSMVFKLVKSAETRWRALRGSELIAKVITGVQFKNGVEVPKQGRQKVAA